MQFPRYKGANVKFSDLRQDSGIRKTKIQRPRYKGASIKFQIFVRTAVYVKPRYKDQDTRELALNFRSSSGQRYT